MEMEKELEQFRQEAQRLKAGRRSGSLPFPEALRAFAVRYAEHTVAAVARRSARLRALARHGSAFRRSCLSERRPTASASRRSPGTAFRDAPSPPP